MGVNWTEEQQKVIDVRNKNVLVSAAAGSGKTAVLVERILSLVCGSREGDTPVDVDRLLVVTFTNAAAAEMRERIGLALTKRLKEEPESVHLEKQQTLIHNAQITTIHSFCQYVIRNYFHQLDLDPSFRIGDEGELKLLKGEVLKELLEDRYAENSPEFVGFVETYAVGKSDVCIEDLILQLYEFSMSYPYPKRWLDGCMEIYRASDREDLNQSKWMGFLLEHVGKLLAGWRQELKGGLDLCGEVDGPYMYQEAILKDLEQVEELCGCHMYEEYQETAKEAEEHEVRESAGQEPEVESEPESVPEQESGQPSSSEPEMGPEPESVPEQKPGQPSGPEPDDNGSDVIQGYLNLYVDGVGSEMRVILGMKDMILEELKQRRISHYDIIYVESVEIQVNPQTLPYILDEDQYYGRRIILN